MLAVLFFGLTVRGLGLVPATAVTALLTALASSRTSILAAVAIAAGLTVLCVLIFVLALQLRLPLFGPWLRSRLGAQMELLDNLALGLGTALQPENVLYCLIGVVLGTAVGVLPGIGPTATIAMLLPITFSLEPVAALIMLAGIYYGAQYGARPRPS